MTTTYAAVATVINMTDHYNFHVTISALTATGCSLAGGFNGDKVEALPVAIIVIGKL